MSIAKEKNRMRYPAEETAQKHVKILEEASRLFREKGFDGVSVSEIMKATGLTHGPFYNHFESKEALMAECLTFAGEKAIADIVSVKKSPKKKAEYVNHYLSKEHRNESGSGCITAALGSQIKNEPLTKETFTAYTKTVLEKLTHEFPWESPSSARKEAIVMLATLVGALVISRAVNDDILSQEILDSTKEALLRSPSD